MFAPAEMPAAVVADVLGRLGIALAAGIDLQRAWATEIPRVPSRWRPVLEGVGRSLAAGATLGEALGASGRFPPLAVALATVGTRTGRDAELLRDAAAALTRTVRLRRDLRRGLVKPALQLALALAVIGLLIVVSGSIGDLDGRPVDMLGLGLTGTRGLAIYLAVVATAIVGGFLLVPAAARSWRGRGAVRRLATAVPVVGPATRAGDAAAWCRAASLAAAVGLDVRALAALAAQVAPAMGVEADAVEARVREGASLAEALATVGRLPRSVIEAVAVGELTGTTAETLDREAAVLEMRSRDGFAAAVEWIGWLAWAGVAVLVAVVVWRFFAFYAGLIDNALRM